MCSFTYVVAQVYGVGLITTRLIPGVAFETGIFIGLGGILVCSFLGGMRAVTWTQVAQYIILIVAYMIPCVWIAVKHTSVPLPQMVYGTVLERVTAREQVLIDDPKEKEVRAIFKKNADDFDAKVKALPKSWEDGKAELQKKIEDLKAAAAPAKDIEATEKALASYPKDAHQLPSWLGALPAFQCRSRRSATAPCRGLWR